MSKNMDTKSILDMNGGAFKERADYVMKQILDNIMDANTSPTAKRKMVINITFTADEERGNIVSDFEIEAKLAKLKPSRTTLYISGNIETGQIQAIEMTPQIPGQYGLDGAEQEAPAILKIADYA